MSSRFFVEPCGDNIELVNKQIAELLDFDASAAQDNVRCQGLKSRKRMWEMSLADCRMLVENGVNVRIWEISSRGGHAKRARWLERARNPATTKKKPRTKRQPEF